MKITGKHGLLSTDNSTGRQCLLLSLCCLAHSLTWSDNSYPATGLVATDKVAIDHYYQLSATDRMNQRWLHNYDSSRGHEGSSALGKLLQRGLKATYKSFRDRGHISQAMPDEEGNGSVSGLDYKVRLKTNSLRFGIEYQF